VKPAGTLPQVFILLLNWNGWRDTIECLKSLENLDYPNSRVIVLDNGSTDGSVERIKGDFPEVEIMELGKNFGFSGGNNRGIRTALQRGAEYVWLLNNDTTVEPQALRSMVEKAETDPKIGAVGPAVYCLDAPDRLQAWGGGYINFWLGRSRHFLRPVADEKIQFLTGASLLLRRPVLESLGLLDEGFFAYWEDSDYCFRLRKAGWRLAVAGNSRIWHRGTATMEKKCERVDLLLNRSAVRFFNKHASIPFIPVWVGVALRIAKRAMAGDWKRVRAVWAGATKADVPALTSTKTSTDFTVPRTSLDHE